MNDVSLNEAQGLYVIKSGQGYSCHGFDVVEGLIAGMESWLKENAFSLPANKGERATLERYAYYRELSRIGAEFSRASGKRCEIELQPKLKGLEGKRVEVTHAATDYKERFWVGRSTGWRPIHLEIKTRRSLGGAGAYIPEGATVRVVAERR